MSDYPAGKPHSGAVVVGRETLEASKVSLLHISSLLKTAEDCFALYDSDLAHRTSLARNVVEKAQWVIGATLLELQLDRLVEVDNWEHPIQVLERPRPPLEDLLRVCEERIERISIGSRPRLIVVREKIERSLRIADSARKRRQRRKKDSDSP